MVRASGCGAAAIRADAVSSRTARCGTAGHIRPVGPSTALSGGSASIGVRAGDRPASLACWTRPRVTRGRCVRAAEPVAAVCSPRLAWPRCVRSWPARYRSCWRLH
jgi:hypothetical protein